MLHLIGWYSTRKSERIRDLRASLLRPGDGYHLQTCSYNGLTNESRVSFLPSVLVVMEIEGKVVVTGNPVKRDSVNVGAL